MQAFESSGIVHYNFPTFAPHPVEFIHFGPIGFPAFWESAINAHPALTAATIGMIGLTIGTTILHTRHQMHIERLTTKK